jgi:hypothetical protein
VMCKTRMLALDTKCQILGFAPPEANKSAGRRLLCVNPAANFQSLPTMYAENKQLQAAVPDCDCVCHSALNDPLLDPSRSKRMELDLCPHFNANARSRIFILVIPPELRAEMDKVYYTRIASLSLPSSKTEFGLQHILDILTFINNHNTLLYFPSQALTFEVERVTFSGILG